MREISLPNPLTFIPKPNTYPEELFIRIFFGSATLQEYYDLYDDSYTEYQKGLAEVDLPVFYIERYQYSDQLKKNYIDWKSKQAGCGKLPTKKQLKTMTPEEIKALEAETLANWEYESYD